MIKELSKLSALSLLGITLSLTSADQAQAQTRISRETNQSSETLVADKVKTGLETVAVDSMMAQLEFMEEGYPADDLYDGWNTEYVKAYKGVEIPDSFCINVSEFVMPIEMSKVTSNYGPRRRRFHYGTDLKLQKGDTVRAAFDGKIRVKNYERRGYGYYLVLRHPNGLETVYGHLSGFLVEQDENVKAGQPIALGGNTGRSTGPHLHFEFRFLGQAINPGEIIDFDELAIKDDQYVFVKNKSGNSYASSGKYTSDGTNKIKYHRIKQGDTLGAIARRYGTTVSKLCKLNKLKTTSTLHLGKSLRIS
ncbi:peptidase [Bacteroidia bacterium]|nr:peptidase [Bacteroidia bacterium]